METPENKNPNSSPTSFLKSFFIFIWDLAKIFVVALVIIVPFRTFVAEPFVVSGNSMLPNFHNKDYLVVDRLSYRASVVKRGDVIVLRPPQRQGEFFIKRIIGLPGETVKVFQGQVYVINEQNPQGVKLDENYLPEHLQTLPNITQKLGSAEYYVFGDNRMQSSDSRSWGILPKENIIGKVWLTVYSQGKLEFKLFKTPSY